MKVYPYKLWVNVVYNNMEGDREFRFSHCFDCVRIYNIGSNERRYHIMIGGVDVSSEPDTAVSYN